MHPLAHYLITCDTTLDVFAQRVCVPIEDLEAVIAGTTLPSLGVIRRIIAESDQALSLADFFGRPHDATGPTNPTNLDPTEIIDFAGRRARSQHTQSHNEPLDAALLEELTHSALGEFVSFPEQSLDIVSLVVECVCTTYDALGPITALHGQARLSQALRPAIQEILANYAEPQLAADIPDSLALRIAQIYWALRQHYKPVSR